MQVSKGSASSEEYKIKIADRIRSAEQHYSFSTYPMQDVAETAMLLGPQRTFYRGSTRGGVKIATSGEGIRGLDFGNIQ